MVITRDAFNTLQLAYERAKNAKKSNLFYNGAEMDIKFTGYLLEHMEATLKAMEAKNASKKI